jgi:hypothetical protein
MIIDLTGARINVQNKSAAAASTPTHYYVSLSPSHREGNTYHVSLTPGFEDYTVLDLSEFHVRLNLLPPGDLG